MTQTIQSVSKSLALSLLLCAAVPAAFAETYSVSAGPIPLPLFPVSVCAADDCQSTPAMGDITLNVDVEVESALSLVPIIVPLGCPAGQTGAAFAVTANTTGTTVSANVHGALRDSEGNPMTFGRKIDVFPLPVLKTVTISACST